MLVILSAAKNLLFAHASWIREKTIALIESGNPTWEDLTEAWYKADSKAKADSSLRSE
jgi:hypothetical protein